MPGDYGCNWPCQELACREAGESVLVGQCCEGLQEIPPTYIYDGNCDDNGMTGWSYLCSDCGNGICESWESACNCPQDCSCSQNGLILWYKFDETGGNIAADSSGYDHNGLVDGPEWPFCPSPEDGEQHVDPCGVVLTWMPGSEATSHRVYFSTDLGEVDTLDPAALEYEGSDTSVPLGDLDDGTVYYWRVVAFNGGGPWEGQVWSFTTYIVDPNLLLWYKFDELAGYMAEDSSGRDNHGFVDGNEHYWEPDGGFYGGCRIFNNDTRIALLPDVLVPISDEITVSLWLRDSCVEDYNNWVLDAGVGGKDAPYKMQVLFDGYTEELMWRAGNDSNDVLTCDWNDIPSPRCWWPGDWHWFIFVKDETEDRISIYVDCALVAAANDVHSNLTYLRGAPFYIGRVLWHNYDLIARMDDFRIYDYAVSEGDIAMGCYFLNPLALAWDPEPHDGDVNVPPDANLTWMPGDYALQHKVFFGKTWEDVNSMTDPCATKNLGDELYEPGPLDLDTTYFWRIDEVNGPNTWKGCVWSFTTANYITVDDFELYQSEQELLDCWIDQRLQPWPQTTGSWLSLMNSPVHTGSKAMEYWYDTADPWADMSYAEAWRIFDGDCPGPQDWTQRGVKILTLFFYGQANNDTNDTEQMYLAIEDSFGEYAEIRYGDYRGEDMNDLTIEEWQRWDIALEDFSSPNYAAVFNDVNLAGITRLYIGFGNRRNPIPGGSGIVYFDDIGLYPPICKSQYAPVGDLTGDCFVDGLDLRLMTQDWLRHDVNFPDLGIEVEEPCDANLVGHWRLDGDANDSSANAYHGTAEGAFTWTTGKIGSGAIHLNGGWVVVEDQGNTPKLRPKHYVSVMAWIYFEAVPYWGHVVIKGRNDVETFGLEVSDGYDYGAMFIMREADYPDDVFCVGCAYALPLDEWIHIAGTYNYNEQAIYVNGVAEDSETRGPIELVADPNDGLGIGGRYPASDTSGRFIGRIDDVRVYDRGLSAGEVAWLATEGSGYVPLTSPANIYDQEPPGQKVVNFKDFALVAQHWLQQTLWPTE
ncbi:MAG: LamG-like jellyroll fold domain-containing protein [Planctomycetota bacterium]|jgi:hypothetical protein